MTTLPTNEVGQAQWEVSSFRDPSARVFFQDQKVYRALDEEAYKNWNILAASKLFSRCQKDRSLVKTEEVSRDLMSLEGRGNFRGILEHERLPMITYPFEWTFHQLKDAALFHLRLMIEALEEGMILKDATPYNIQWRGINPVFIDIPSIVPLAEKPIWEGYRQFCQLFLFPLLLQAHKGIPFQPWLRGSLEGISPSDAARHFGILDWFRKGVFGHVFLQSLIQEKSQKPKAGLDQEVKKVGLSRNMILQNVRSMANVVRSLKLSAKKSAWSEYVHHNEYTDDSSAQKEDFVRKALELRKPQKVWDLGANTGTFSLLAAQYSTLVVAIESDHDALDHLYLRLKEKKGESIVLALMDVTDPSPAMGWELRERGEWISRSKPDFILCLALLHHLVISRNIPIRRVLEFLASFGANIVLEFVGPSDPMTRLLMKRKSRSHDGYNQENFEKVTRSVFHIQDSIQLKGSDRHLYLLNPR